MPTVTPAIKASGPVVEQGPVTTSAPLNAVLGASVVGGANVGATMLTGDPLATAMALFLNLIAQPIKKIKWFPEKEGLIVLMLVVSFGLGYFMLYQGDPIKSFVTSAISTMLAKLNYKGDKASGLNILEPTPANKEFKE